MLNFLSLGKDVLFDIDWQGTQQLKRIKDLSLVTIFILPPDIHVLRKRLLNRHHGQENLIEERMKQFNEDINHWENYDFVVINDNIDRCYKEIIEFINKKIEKSDHTFDKKNIQNHIVNLRG